MQVHETWYITLKEATWTIFTRHMHKWWHIADGILCLSIPQARKPISMGEENVTYADLSDVILKTFKVLEDILNSK